jgi:hypothetical protein
MLSGALLPSLLLATGCAVDIASSAARRARVIVLCFRLDFQIGGGAVVLATLFFTLALDRSVDHLRVLHGAWHALIATGYWLLLRAVIGVDALRREEELGKGEGGYTWRARRDGGGGGGATGAATATRGGRAARCQTRVAVGCGCWTYSTPLGRRESMNAVAAAGAEKRAKGRRCSAAAAAAAATVVATEEAPRGGESRREARSRSRARAWRCCAADLELRLRRRAVVARRLRTLTRRWGLIRSMRTTALRCSHRHCTSRARRRRMTLSFATPREKRGGGAGGQATKYIKERERRVRATGVLCAHTRLLEPKSACGQ